MTTDSLTTTCYQHADNIVTRKIAGEVVLVPICGEIADLQKLFTLNDVGEFLWAKMEDTHTPEELIASLVQEFDVGQAEAEGDVREFLTNLHESGLIAEAT